MDWYKIPEIPFKDYVACLEKLYTVLEKKHKSKSKPDVYLKCILASYSGMTIEQWESMERARLYQVALSMKLGDFHEELMGKFPKYKTLPTGHITGCDVSNANETMFFEVKNRQNTMNADSGKQVVRKLSKLVENGHTAVLVYVNSWTKKLPRFGAPHTIRIMNDQQSYELLSGRKDFHKDLQLTLAETFLRFKTYAELLETTS